MNHQLQEIINLLQEMSFAENIDKVTVEMIVSYPDSSSSIYEIPVQFE